jgi:hypothetical protein
MPKKQHATPEEAIRHTIAVLGGYGQLDERISWETMKTAFEESIPHALREESFVLLDDKLFDRWLDLQVAAARHRQASDEFERKTAAGKPLEVIDARTSVIAEIGDHVQGPPMVRPVASGPPVALGNAPGYMLLGIEDRGPLDVVVTIRRDDKTTTDDVQLAVRTTLPNYVDRRMGIVPADAPALLNDLPIMVPCENQG